MNGLWKKISLSLVTVVLAGMVLVGCTMPDSVRTSIVKSYNIVSLSITALGQVKDSIKPDTELGKQILPQLEVIQTALAVAKQTIITIATFTGVSLDMTKVAITSTKDVFTDLINETKDLRYENEKLLFINKK